MVRPTLHPARAVQDFPRRSHISIERGHSPRQPDLEAGIFMKLFPKFSDALPLTDFLAQYGTASDRPRWESALAATQLTDAQTQLLGKFKREMNVLVLAGAWCGDCISQCPPFERFAEAAQPGAARRSLSSVHFRHSLLVTT
jgi:hypothetical protein